MLSIGTVVKPDAHAIEVYSGTENGNLVIVLVAKQGPFRIERR